jgi:hypothetical protein
MVGGDFVGEVATNVEVAPIVPTAARSLRREV